MLFRSIFLVPEDIVDIRPRLVRLPVLSISHSNSPTSVDHDVCRQSDGTGPVDVVTFLNIGNESRLVIHNVGNITICSTLVAPN